MKHWSDTERDDPEAEAPEAASDAPDVTAELWDAIDNRLVAMRQDAAEIRRRVAALPPLTAEERAKGIVWLKKHRGAPSLDPREFYIRKTVFLQRKNALDQADRLAMNR